METIQLHLSLEEVNLIVKALGDRPFHEVFELIGKINAQATIQLHEGESDIENDNIEEKS